jgi:hypothetical protein
MVCWIKHGGVVVSDIAVIALSSYYHQLSGTPCMNTQPPLADAGRRNRRKAMPIHQRRQRRNNRRMSLTTADQLELENSVKGTFFLKLLDALPLLAW